MTARTISTCLEENARCRPLSPAFLDRASEINYSELNKQAEKWAGFLKSKNIHKGDRVLLLSRNQIPAVGAFFGALRAGAVACWVNPLLDAALLERIADDLKPAYFLTEKEFSDKIKTTGQASFLEDELPAASLPIPDESAENSAAVILYTSGSTGSPLGVLLSHKNLLVNGRAVAQYMQLNEKSRMFTALPFYHSFGLSLLVSHLTAGASLFLENQFIYPQTALDALQTSRCTGFAGVSSHYAILLKNTSFKEQPLLDLKFFAQAGDSMPEKLTKEIRDSHPEKKVYLMYGQTEAGPRLTYLDPSKADKKPRSVGQAVSGVEIQIEASGEILAKGDNVMMGYWNNQELTQKKIKNGWLHTGDIGYRDADGDIYITGRMDDMIKVGGQRLSLREIERELAGDPAVLEVAAVAVPDAVLGFRVEIFYSGPAGKKAIFPQSSWGQNAAFKMHQIAELPKNSTGKIDKEKLKKLIEKENHAA